MFSQKCISVILLISTFAIHYSLQLSEVANWADFENILKTNKGPLALILSNSKHKVQDGQLFQENCDAHPPCTCYQGVEETSASTFYDHFQNNALPVVAFYNNGKEVQVLKQSHQDAQMTVKQEVTPAIVNGVFDKICPKGGSSNGGNPPGGNPPGGNPPGGNPPGGNPPGGNPPGGNPPGGNPPGGNPPGGNPPGGNPPGGK